MEVSMKSKLFLSLSLLTAVFSAQAESSTTTFFSELEEQSRNVNLSYIPRHISYQNLVDSDYELEQAAKLANRSYFQVAKDGMSSACNTVKTKVSSAYNSAVTKTSGLYNAMTLENVKSGFNSVKTYAQENPYKTTGAVVGTVAIAYGAYKLYNSDMFAKSKKQTVIPSVVKQPAPVKKTVTIKRSAYMGA